MKLFAQHKGRIKKELSNARVLRIEVIVKNQGEHGLEIKPRFPVIMKTKKTPPQTN